MDELGLEHTMEVWFDIKHQSTIILHVLEHKVAGKAIDHRLFQL